MLCIFVSLRCVWPRKNTGSLEGKFGKPCYVGCDVQWKLYFSTEASRALTNEGCVCRFRITRGRNKNKCETSMTIAREKQI